RCFCAARTPHKSQVPTSLSTAAGRPSRAAEMRTGLFKCTVKEDGRRTATIDQEKETIPNTYDFLRATGVKSSSEFFVQFMGPDPCRVMRDRDSWTRRSVGHRGILRSAEDWNHLGYARA